MNKQYDFFYYAINVFVFFQTTLTLFCTGIGLFFPLSVSTLLQVSSIVFLKVGFEYLSHLFQDLIKFIPEKIEQRKSPVVVSRVTFMNKINWFHHQMGSNILRKTHKLIFNIQITALRCSSF
uniref:ABC transmembrane type-1 domain-containing protein n=1 Tax=Heterorhabditis bacteriophora TaxID=37862 RepID=A0A1I7WJN3_HETBA